jgi:hypothetical protein
MYAPVDMQSKVRLKREDAGILSRVSLPDCASLVALQGFTIRESLFQDEPNAGLHQVQPNRDASQVASIPRKQLEPTVRLSGLVMSAHVPGVRCLAPREHPSIPSYGNDMEKTALAFVRQMKGGLKDGRWRNSGCTQTCLIRASSSI